MTITSPEPARTLRAMTLEDDPARTMLDLTFMTRECIADLLNSPRQDTVGPVQGAVSHFLDTERRLLLSNPANRARLGIDLTELMAGRRAVRQALNRVAWSEAGSYALAQHIEALRLAFLRHAELYTRRRPTHPRAHRTAREVGGGL